MTRMQFSGSQRTLPIYNSCCGVTPGPVLGPFFHLYHKRNDIQERNPSYHHLYLCTMLMITSLLSPLWMTLQLLKKS